MIVVDVNLPLYAHITAFPQHERARQWWEDVLSSERAVGLCPVTVFGFVRLATNRRVIDPPMPGEAARGHARGWRARPGVESLVPGPRHVDVAFGLLADLGTAANLSTDVQLAALSLEYDAELYSADTDFGRFADVRWENPLR